MKKKNVRYLAKRAEVEALARQLGDHPVGMTLRGALASSDQQEFELWLPEEFILQQS